MAYRKRSSGYQRRSQRGGLSKDTQGKLILVATFIALGALAFAYYGATTEASHIGTSGEDKFCRTDSLPEVTAIVIDHTDKISPIQKRAIEQRLSDVAADVKKNGSLRFYTVKENEADVLDVKFELCNPGSAKDTSQLTGNQRLAKKRYDEQFASIVEDNLLSVLEAETAQRSPIMKTIKAAAVDSFMGDNKADSYKRLVIVSDLLEHSANFSLYKSVLSFEDFEKTSFWPSVRSNLKGVDVEILFLHREGLDTEKTENLKFFWKIFFTQQGANKVIFLSI